MNDPLQAIIDRHEAALRGMKAEIDALQIAATEPRKRWYQQAGTLIAAIALITSIFGGLYSYWKSSTDAENALHNDLRRIVLQLTDIPLKGIEAADRYANNPTLVSSATTLLFQQTTTLTFQAGGIVDRIPHLIKSEEYLAVASAFLSIGMTEKARRFFEEAVRLAQTSLDLNLAYRQLGALSFMEHKPEEARQYFQRALGVFNEPRFARLHNEDNKRFFLANSELDWAKLETYYFAGCVEAIKHLALARDYISVLLPKPREPMERDIQAEEDICAGNNVPPPPIGMPAFSAK